MENMHVLHTADLSSEKTNITEGLLKLKELDTRIIIGDFNSSLAGQIFCEAYREKLYGPNYVWILPGYHDRRWWLRGAMRDGAQPFYLKQTTTDGNCTAGCDTKVVQHCREKQVIEALEGHFIMEYVTYRDDFKIKGYNNKSAWQYFLEYERRCTDSPHCEPKNRLHAYAYDGIWALAVALDHVLQDFESSSDHHGFKPAFLSFNRSWFEAALSNALNATDFQGMTGRIRFQDNERLGRIRIAQFRNGTYVNVGEYDAPEDRFKLFNDKLTGWVPPLDATLVRRDHQHVSAVLYFSLCALSVAGIVLSLFFLAINIHFKNHRYIRMSSPHMNNLIIAGSVMTYISVILLGLDSRTVGTSGYVPLCYAKIWVLTLGFTLAFGSMFSKTWRVHSIFTNIKLNKKAIKDYQLFLIVGFLLLVDAMVLGVWAGIAPTKLKLQELAPVDSKTKEVKIVQVIEQCDSQFAIIFQSLLYGFKGLLLVLGCFLAWETRHVNVPALNDSKYIGMSVYNVVLMCILGLSLSFILENRVNESYCLISIFIIFCTTLTLCLVFVPKVIELIRNPKGTETRYKQGLLKSNVSSKSSWKRPDPSFEDQQDKLLREEQDNFIWHKQLDEKMKEICQIEAQLTLHGDDLDVPKNKESFVESTSTVPEDPFGGVYIGPADIPKVPSAKLAEPKFTQLVPSPKSPHPDEVTEETSLLLHCNSVKKASTPAAGPFLTKLRNSLKRNHTRDWPEDPNGIPHSNTMDPFIGDNLDISLRPASRTSSKAWNDMLGSSQLITGVYYSMPDLAPLDRQSPGFRSTEVNTTFMEPVKLVKGQNSLEHYMDHGRHAESVPPHFEELSCAPVRTLRSIDEAAALSPQPTEMLTVHRPRYRMIPMVWPWLDPSLPVSDV